MFPHFENKAIFVGTLQGINIILDLYFIDLDLLVYISVVFAIASVLFASKESIWVFPTGIIGTLIQGYLCFVSWKLYADGVLNIYYVLASIYGWYFWSKKKNEVQTPITKTANIEWFYYFLVFTVLFIGSSFYLKTSTDSPVPMADAFTTSLSIVAMWSMARKKLENWLMWIVVDAVSVPLYYYRDAPEVAVQFLVFCAIAIYGYLQWRKKIMEV